MVFPTGQQQQQGPIQNLRLRTSLLLFWARSSPPCPSSSPSSSAGSSPCVLLFPFPCHPDSKRHLVFSCHFSPGFDLHFLSNANSESILSLCSFGSSNSQFALNAFFFLIFLAVRFSSEICRTKDFCFAARFLSGGVQLDLEPRCAAQKRRLSWIFSYL